MAELPAPDTPPVEIVLGGHSDALLELVGRYGTGLAPGPAHHGGALRGTARGRAGARRSRRAAIPREIVPGIYLYAVIHEDHDVAVKALEGLLLRDRRRSPGNSDAVRRRPGSSTRSVPASRALRDYIPEWVPAATVRDAANDLPVDGAQHFVVHGTPAEIVAHLQPFVDAGVRRVVLDNLLPLGIPEELEGANRATRAAIRAARARRSGVRRDDRCSSSSSAISSGRCAPIRGAPTSSSRPAPTRFPYFVPVGSPLGREVVVDGVPQAHVRLEQLPRARRRPPRRGGGAPGGRHGTGPAAPAPG